MGVLSWIVMGLLAGTVAKALYPGEQGGGILTTMLLGIIGSFVGGWLGQKLLNTGEYAGSFTVVGLATAVVGALVVIFIWGVLTAPSE